jgi:hypothetical protein
LQQKRLFLSDNAKKQRGFAALQGFGRLMPSG